MLFLGGVAWKDPLRTSEYKLLVTSETNLGPSVGHRGAVFEEGSRRFA